VTFHRTLFPLLLIALVGTIALAQSESTVTSPNLTFTTIDFPGAVATNVYDINSLGDMVGIYSGVSLPDHGFLYRSGVFTTIDYPSGYSSQAAGINDSGVIVGASFNRQLNASVGFLYDGTNFSPIRVPGVLNTEAWGINNAGTIVGGDGDFGGNEGFALISGKFMLPESRRVPRVVSSCERTPSMQTFAA